MARSTPITHRRQTRARRYRPVVQQSQEPPETRAEKFKKSVWFLGAEVIVIIVTVAALVVSAYEFNQAGEDRIINFFNILVDPRSADVSRKRILAYLVGNGETLQGLDLSCAAMNNMTTRTENGKTIEYCAKRVNLTGLDVSKATTGKRANLIMANLSWADLTGADLREADLREADLREADLREADLREADLREADLRGADLRGADLREADLRGADLRGADLREADLSEADLREADLRGSRLCARAISARGRSARGRSARGRSELGLSDRGLSARGRSARGRSARCRSDRGRSARGRSARCQSDRGHFH